MKNTVQEELTRGGTAEAGWSLHDWAAMICRVNAEAERIEFPRFREVMADQR